MSEDFKFDMGAAVATASSPTMGGLTDYDYGQRMKMLTRFDTSTFEDPQYVHSFLVSTAGLDQEGFIAAAAEVGGYRTASQFAAEMQQLYAQYGDKRPTDRQLEQLQQRWDNGGEMNQLVARSGLGLTAPDERWEKEKKEKWWDPLADAWDATLGKAQHYMGVAAGAALRAADWPGKNIRRSFRAFAMGPSYGWRDAWAEAGRYGGEGAFDVGVWKKVDEIIGGDRIARDIAYEMAAAGLNAEEATAKVLQKLHGINANDPTAAASGNAEYLADFEKYFIEASDPEGKIEQASDIFDQNHLSPGRVIAQMLGFDNKRDTAPFDFVSGLIDGITTVAFDPLNYVGIGDVRHGAKILRGAVRIIKAGENINDAGIAMRGVGALSNAARISLGRERLRAGLINPQGEPLLKQVTELLGRDPATRERFEKAMLGRTHDDIAQVLDESGRVTEYGEEYFRQLHAVIGTAGDSSESFRRLAIFVVDTFNRAERSPIAETNLGLILEAFGGTRVSLNRSIFEKADTLLRGYSGEARTFADRMAEYDGVSSVLAMRRHPDVNISQEGLTAAQRALTVDEAVVNARVAGLIGTGALSTTGGIRGLADFVSIFGAVDEVGQLGEMAIVRGELGRLGYRRMQKGWHVMPALSSAGYRRMRLKLKVQARLDDWMEASGRFTKELIETDFANIDQYRSWRNQEAALARVKTNTAKLIRSFVHQLPTSQTVDLSSTQGLKVFQQFLEMGMSHRRAVRIVTDVIMAGQHGLQRQAVSEGIRATMIQMGVSDQMVTSFIEKVGLEGGKGSQQFYSQFGLDVLPGLTQSGTRRAALLEYQLADSKIRLPKWREMQRTLENATLWETIFNKTLGSQKLDRLIGGVWKPLLLLRLSFPIRAALEETIGMIGRLGPTSLVKQWVVNPMRNPAISDAEVPWFLHPAALAARRMQHWQYKADFERAILDELHLPADKETLDALLGRGIWRRRNPSRVLHGEALRRYLRARQTHLVGKGQIPFGPSRPGVRNAFRPAGEHANEIALLQRFRHWAADKANAALLDSYHRAHQFGYYRFEGGKSAEAQAIIGTEHTIYGQGLEGRHTESPLPLERADGTFVEMVADHGDMRQYAFGDPAFIHTVDTHLARRAQEVGSRAVHAAFAWHITDEVSDEVGRSLTAVLDSLKSRAGRVDIGAIPWATRMIEGGDPRAAILSIRQLLQRNPALREAFITLGRIGDQAVVEAQLASSRALGYAIHVASSERGVRDALMTMFPLLSHDARQMLLASDVPLRAGATEGLTKIPKPRRIGGNARFADERQAMLDRRNALIDRAVYDPQAAEDLARELFIHHRTTASGARGWRRFERSPETSEGRIVGDYAPDGHTTAYLPMISEREFMMLIRESLFRRADSIPNPMSLSEHMGLHPVPENLREAVAKVSAYIAASDEFTSVEDLLAYLARNIRSNIERPHAGMGEEELTASLERLFEATLDGEELASKIGLSESEMLSALREMQSRRWGKGYQRMITPEGMNPVAVARARAVLHEYIGLNTAFESVDEFIERLMLASDSELEAMDRMVPISVIGSRNPRTAQKEADALFYALRGKPEGSLPGASPIKLGYIHVPNGRLKTFSVEGDAVDVIRLESGKGLDLPVHRLTAVEGTPMAIARRDLRVGPRGEPVSWQNFLTSLLVSDEIPSSMKGPIEALIRSLGDETGSLFSLRSYEPRGWVEGGVDLDQEDVTSLFEALGADELGQERILASWSNLAREADTGDIEESLLEASSGLSDWWAWPDGVPDEELEDFARFFSLAQEHYPLDAETERQLIARFLAKRWRAARENHEISDPAYRWFDEASQSSTGEWHGPRPWLMSPVDILNEINNLKFLAAANLAIDGRGARSAGFMQDLRTLVMGGERSDVEEFADFYFSQLGWAGERLRELLPPEALMVGPLSDALSSEELWALSNRIHESWVQRARDVSLPLRFQTPPQAYRVGAWAESGFSSPNGRWLGLSPEFMTQEDYVNEVQSLLREMTTNPTEEALGRLRELVPPYARFGDDPVSFFNTSRLGEESWGDVSAVDPWEQWLIARENEILRDPSYRGYDAVPIESGLGEPTEWLIRRPWLMSPEEFETLVADLRWTLDGVYIPVVAPGTGIVDAYWHYQEDYGAWEIVDGMPEWLDLDSMLDLLTDEQLLAIERFTQLIPTDSVPEMWSAPELHALWSRKAAAYVPTDENSFRPGLYDDFLSNGQRGLTRAERERVSQEVVVDMAARSLYGPTWRDWVINPELHAYDSGVRVMPVSADPSLSWNDSEVVYIHGATPMEALEDGARLGVEEIRRSLTKRHGRGIHYTIASPVGDNRYDRLDLGQVDMGQLSDGWYGPSYAIYDPKLEDQVKELLFDGVAGGIIRSIARNPLYKEAYEKTWSRAEGILAPRLRDAKMRDEVRKTMVAAGMGGSEEEVDALLVALDSVMTLLPRARREEMTPAWLQKEIQRLFTDHSIAGEAAVIPRFGSLLAGIADASSETRPMYESLFEQEFDSLVQGLPMPMDSRQRQNLFLELRRLAAGPPEVMPVSIRFDRSLGARLDDHYEPVRGGGWTAREHVAPEVRVLMDFAAARARRSVAKRTAQVDDLSAELSEVRGLLDEAAAELERRAAVYEKAVAALEEERRLVAQGDLPGIDPETRQNMWNASTSRDLGARKRDEIAAKIVELEGKLEVAEAPFLAAGRFGKGGAAVEQQMEMDGMEELLEKLSLWWQNEDRALEAIDHAAHVAAFTETVRYIDDPSIKSLAADKLRNVIPFYHAEEQFAKRWARILAEQDMRAVARVQRLYHGMDALGWIEEDGYGNKVYNLPGTDVLTATMGRAFALIFGEGPNVLPSVTFSAGVQASIPGFEGRFPSFSASPVATIPLTYLADTFPALMPLKYGVMTERGAYKNAWEQVLPSTVVRIATAFGVMDEEQIVHATINAMQQLEAAGHGLEDTLKAEGYSQEQIDAIAADPVRAKELYIDRVQNWAKNILLIKAALGFVSPGSPQLRFDGELDTEFRDLLRDTGDYQVASKLLLATHAADTDSGAWDELRALQAEAKGGMRSLEETINLFVAAHPDATPYTLFPSESVSGAPLPASLKTAEWMKENSDLIEQYPQAAPWLIPAEITGHEDEYYAPVYRQQQAMGMRVLKAPETFYEEMKFASAAHQYFPEQDRVDAALAKASSDAERKEIKERWRWRKQHFFQTHPLFFKMLSDPSRQQEREKKIEDLHEILGPGGPMHERPEYRAHRALDGLWQEYQSLRSRLAQSSTDIARAQKRMLDAHVFAAMDKYTLANPGVRDLFWRLYRPEFRLNEVEQEEASSMGTLNATTVDQLVAMMDRKAA